MAAVLRPLRRAGLAGGVILLSFLVLLALLVVSAVISYGNVGAILDNGRSVDHAYEVLDTLDVTTASLNGAEGSARGYILTGLNIFDEEFKVDKDQVKNNLVSLQNLTADNSAQQRRLNDLRPGLAQRFTTLQAAVDLRRATGHPPAPDPKRSDAVLKLRDKVKSILRAIGNEEHRLLEVRSQRTAESLSLAQTSFSVMTVMALLGLVGFYMLVSRLIDAQSRMREMDRERANELEERVKERTAELTSANQDLESFSYSVSHDLRAPLRAIGFFTRVLQDEAPDLAPENKELLSGIVAAAKKMSNLIDALLNLGRYGRSELKEESIDLTVLANQVLADLAPKETEQTVQISADPGLRVLGDQNLITVLVTNLVGNAFKFASKVPEPIVRVGRRSTDRGPAFFVEDNGAGFDSRHADKLFKPFERLHPEKEFAGTGIGLAICERIVRRHGGQIWADSTPGHGATFYFTLPTPDLDPRGDDPVSPAAMASMS